MRMSKRTIVFFACVVFAVIALVRGGALEAMALSKRVYAGGFPIAMVFDIDGAVIDEVGVVKTAAGDATLANKLRRGDTITKIDGVKVAGCDEVVSTVEGGDGDEITLTLIRDGKETTANVTPYIDSDSGLFKLGIYIRDTISGVGTVTYVRENGYFGALGHQIVDGVAGSAVPLLGGKVYNCDIVGITKGKRNEAGELRATIKGEPIGEIYSNLEAGVFGRFFDFVPQTELLSLGARSSALPGKAYIITTVGDGPVTYEVDIIRALSQNEPTPKGLLLRVTDRRLLAASGGIVQGMSGSPIIQNGKIVGAVTHVLVADPTKGYGIYTDWMQSA